MTRPKVPDDKRQRTAQACDSCKRRKQKVGCCCSSTSHFCFSSSPSPLRCGYLRAQCLACHFRETRHPPDEPPDSDFCHLRWLRRWFASCRHLYPRSARCLSAVSAQPVLSFFHLDIPRRETSRSAAPLLEGNACLNRAGGTPRLASCSPSCYEAQGRREDGDPDEVAQVCACPTAPFILRACRQVMRPNRAWVPG